MASKQHNNSALMDLENLSPPILSSSLIQEPLGNGANPLAHDKPQHLLQNQDPETEKHLLFKIVR